MITNSSVIDWDNEFGSDVYHLASEFVNEMNSFLSAPYKLFETTIFFNFVRYYCFVDGIFFQINFCKSGIEVRVCFYENNELVNWVEGEFWYNDPNCNPECVVKYIRENIIWIQHRS